MKKLLLLILLLVTANVTAGMTEWIDFTLDRGHIKVPITVGGIQTQAILDTGASVNGINQAFINKNNLSFDKGSKMRIRGVFGVKNKATYNNVPINFFGMETEMDRLVSSSLGIHTTGILLGAGFFDKFVVQLDYPNSKMRLITHDSIRLKDFKNIDIQRQKGTGMPIVKVRIGEDKHLWLLFDTGNSGGLLVERRVASRMGWLENLDSKSSISMGVNSTSAIESFRIPLLGFGPYNLENVKVSIPAEGEKTYVSSQFQRTGSRIKGKKVQGIIGYDVLKHFLISIDYKKGLAHVGLPEETE